MFRFLWEQRLAVNELRPWFIRTCVKSPKIIDVMDVNYEFSRCDLAKKFIILFYGDKTIRNYSNIKITGSTFKNQFSQTALIYSIAK